MNLLKKVVGFSSILLDSVCLTSCIGFGDIYADSNKYLAGTQYYDGELTKLDLHWTKGEVTIIEDDSAEFITVKEDNTLDDVYKVHSYFVDGTLHIRSAASGKSLTFINSQDKKLFVTFPKLDEIVVDITSGKVNVDKLDCDNATFNLTSGTINVGELNVKENTKVNVTSGTVTIDSLSTKEGKFNCTSGKVITNVKKAETMKFSFTSGTLDLTIPEAGAKVTFKKTSGSYTSHREHTVDNNVYTYGDGSCEISISITSGKVIVR